MLPYHLFSCIVLLNIPYVDDNNRRKTLWIIFLSWRLNLLRANKADLSRRRNNVYYYFGLIMMCVIVVVCGQWLQVLVFLPFFSQNRTRGRKQKRETPAGTMGNGDGGQSDLGSGFIFPLSHASPWKYHELQTQTRNSSLIEPFFSTLSDPLVWNWLCCWHGWVWSPRTASHTHSRADTRGLHTVTNTGALIGE